MARAAAPTLAAAAASSGVVVPIASARTSAPVELDPRTYLDALADREGLRGQRRLAMVLALLALRACDRGRRPAAIRRAFALLCDAAAVVKMMQNAGDSPAEKDWTE